MSSALQQLYASPDSELPDVIVNAMKELREGDENIQILAKTVAGDRNALFQEMKGATDEGDFKERIDAIAAKNKQIVELTGRQQKQAEAAYQCLSNIVFELDKKRAVFYDKIPDHQTMIKKQKTQEVKAAASNEKKASATSNKAANISTKTVYSNEPIYCICKKVSFGRMIGCDNDSCPIEWFHFPCVGLDESLPDPDEWFCSVCAPSCGGGAQAT